MNKVYKASDIANHFIYKSKIENNTDLTVLKLIKLVYIGYGWCLATLDRKIFNEKIEAWKHGPVVPSIYYEFKRFRDATGMTNINEYAIDFDLNEKKEEINSIYSSVDEKDEDIIKILNAVWKKYKNYSGWELRNLTHEGPWKKFYQKEQNNEIKEEDIKNISLIAIESFIEEEERNEKR
jgi:uncharacterized phage-associated protein